MRARAVWLRWGLVVGAITACATPRTTNAPPPEGPRSPSRLEAHAGVREVVYVFAPSGAPVVMYNGIPPEAPPTTPLYDAIYHQALEITQRAGVPAPMLDPRLYRVASDLARIVPRDDTLPYAPVEFALSHHGIIEPTPAMLVTFAHAAEPTTIAEVFGPRLAKLLAGGEYSRIGMGTVQRDGGQDATVVLLQKSFIETEPIPRVLRAGSSFRLRGRLLGAFRSPRVVVTREDGVVEQRPVKRGRGRRFEAPIDCGAEPGMRRVEVAGESNLGAAVLANFPVWCGADPPADTAWSVRTGGDATDATLGERRMVELINASRHKAGLPPLEPDEELAEIARAHGRNMMARDVVAHTLDGEDVRERVTRAGLDVALVAENIARSGDVVDAHRGLMNSPGHRANILLPDATHVGVGIVVGEGGDLFVTQVFVRRPPRLSMEEAHRELSAKVADVAGLRQDPGLDAVAATHAAALARGVGAGAAMKATVEAVGSQGLPFGRLRAIQSVVNDTMAFSGEGAAQVGMTHFGLGVARGPHPELGAAALYVVVLLGADRDGPTPGARPR